MYQWLCTVCGYMHDEEESPGSCPVCGAPRKAFKMWNEEDVEDVNLADSENGGFEDNDYWGDDYEDN